MQSEATETAAPGTNPIQPGDPPSVDENQLINNGSVTCVPNPDCVRVREGMGTVCT